MLLTWLLSCALAVPFCAAVDVTIGFEREHYTVGEEEGRVEVCAAVLQGELQGAEQESPTFDTTRTGAAGSLDFIAITGQQFTFTSAIQRVCVDIEILEDESVEDNETFTVVLLDFSVTINPNQATVQIVDNDVIVIGITTNDSLVSEDVGVAKVTVSVLQGVLFRPLVLQLFTVDGTSIAPVDYTAMNNNITLNRAVAKVNHSISVVDDQCFEYDEHFFVKLNLLSLSASLQDVTLSNDNLSISITDNDVVTVGFVSEIYNVTENETSVVVCTKLFEGSTEREFSVCAVVITDSTATNNDYGSLPQTLVFLFNTTTSLSCLEIEVTDDHVFESPEEFTLQLHSTTTSIMLRPDTATINIADNDMVTVGFEFEIYNATENEERVVVCVRLFEGTTEREFSVNAVVISGSTATIDLDYILPHSMALLFNTNTSLSCLEIEVKDDPIFEPPEQFTLHLNTSTAFVILRPNTAVIKIADNDDGTSCPPEMLFTASGNFPWMRTPAGSMATLPCPIGPVNVNATRQCDAHGNWLDHDASRCSDEFDLILAEEITIDTYEAQAERLLAAVQRTVPSEQNKENVDNTALFLNVTANLLQANATATVPQEVVSNTVGIISSIQTWPPETVREQGSNIVQSVESVFQSVVTRENFTVLNVIDTNLAFRGERINTADFLLEGHSFSDSRLDAADSNISLSSEAIMNLNDSTVNFVFTIYKESILFPVEADGNKTIATPILGAFIPNVDTSFLNSPSKIYFQLNQTMNVTNHTCVSWDFNLNSGSGGWSSEGCDIVISETDSSVVMCLCNHLTNFAVLVDICSRTGCNPIPPRLALALDILSIIGVTLSLLGIIATVITLLAFKKLRMRDTTKFHVQLCAALFCMLLVFVIGIDRTAIYGGCVTVSVLIHYFTLVSVMWMGAEAILMFQKLVIVFIQITTKYIIAVSIICWTVPLILVIIPLAVNTDFMVSFDAMGQLQFCFIGNTAVFFGAFLGPIFAIILFNMVIFVVVVFVIVKHTISSSRRVKSEKMDTKTAVRIIISVSGVMFLFGLTWLFGALTVTGATLAFQVFFAIFNSLQGFFIFLFFCIFSRDARELWKETLSCGRYYSRILHPSWTKSTNSVVKKNTSDIAMTSYATSTLRKTVQSELSEDVSNYIELPVKEPSDEKSQQSIDNPTTTMFTSSFPPVSIEKTPVDVEDSVEVGYEVKSCHNPEDPTTNALVSSSVTTDEQKKSNEEKEKADSSKANSPEADDGSPVPDGDVSLKATV